VYSRNSIRYDCHLNHRQKSCCHHDNGTCGCCSSSGPFYGPLNKLPSKSLIIFPCCLGILIPNQTSPIFANDYDQHIPLKGVVRGYIIPGYFL
jgi:hypothetical protein